MFFKNSDLFMFVVVTFESIKVSLIKQLLFNLALDRIYEIELDSLEGVQFPLGPPGLELLGVDNCLLRISRFVSHEELHALLFDDVPGVLVETFEHLLNCQLFVVALEGLVDLLRAFLDFAIFCEQAINHLRYVLKFVEVFVVIIVFITKVKLQRDTLVDLHQIIKFLQIFL